MPSYIPEEIIEEIRNSNDIVSIISEYIPLKKTGKNYQGLCPFHSEKTPSFMVSSDKQIFHCFGCGIGGNVFNFIMRYENISYPEAIKQLAVRANILIPTDSKKDFSNKEFKEREILYKNNNTTNGFNLTYKINETNLKLKMKYNYSDTHNFDYGLESKLYRVNPGKVLPSGSNSTVTPLNIRQEKALENALVALINPALLIPYQMSGWPIWPAIEALLTILGVYSEEASNFSVSSSVNLTGAIIFNCNE